MGKKGVSPSIFVGNFQFRVSSRPSRLSRSVGYTFIDGNLILEWTTEATIRLSRRSAGRLIDRPSFAGGGESDSIYYDLRRPIGLAQCRNICHVGTAQLSLLPPQNEKGGGNSFLSLPIYVREN